MTAKAEPGSALTSRESEVARLTAEGKTNCEIARSLSLSVRTVECHLWAAYRKTGTGTRIRLALWLTRHEPATKR